MVLSICLVALALSAQEEHPLLHLEQPAPGAQVSDDLPRSGIVRATFEGIVVGPDGSISPGALVVSDAGGMAVAGPDGSFRIQVELSPEAREVRFTAVQGAGVGRAVGSAVIRVPGHVRTLRIGSLALTGSSCDSSWLPSFGALPGVRYEVEDLVVFDDGSGPALFVAGSFNLASGVVASNVARWDGTSWSDLDGGTNGRVHALEAFDDGSGTKLFAAGTFNQAGGNVALRIAAWDGTDWQPVGGGVNGVALCMTIFGGELHVGGAFTTAGGISANRVARWSGTSWSALGLGRNADVNDMAVFDDGLGGGPALHAVGDFTDRVARWDGTSWQTVGNGITTTGAEVLAVAASDVGGSSKLYVGGAFDQVGGVSGITAYSVAAWDGTSWSALGGGIDGLVETLLPVLQGGNPVLIAGGNLTWAGGTTVDDIAVWNGTDWSTLGSGTLGSWSGSSVRALAQWTDGSLYAGGNYETAGEQPASSLSHWDGANWTAAEFGSGINSDVDAVAVLDLGSGPALYVTGSFTGVAGVPANRIARYDGHGWSALGLGLNRWGSTMAVFDDGLGGGPALYVGGDFTLAGGVNANRIARWDGENWWPLGSGFNAHLHQILVFDDGTGPALYACGDFTTAGGVAAAHIAKWNGTNWSKLGAGVSGFALCMAVFDAGTGPQLYVGGLFTSAGGLSASRVARWNGTSWSALPGGGTNDQVYDLQPVGAGTLGGPALYAAGMFTGAGGLLANRVARWDGSTWSALGSGLNHWTFSMCVFDDGSGPALYASGDFTTAGGVPASRIARWDGTSWSAMGGGLDEHGWSMDVFDDGSGPGPALYVGGVFGRAIDTGDSNLARWSQKDTPPTIAAPDYVHVPDAGAPGEIVSFTVTASDTCDPAPSLTCVPPSGSFFPPGRTMVTCTASDSTGNQAVRRFPVFVGKVRRR